MSNADEPNTQLPGELSCESGDVPASVLTAAQFPAYILCGGNSVRFGSNKARVSIDGQPHLLRLAKSLRHQGHETHFVADSSDRYLDLGIATIVDAQPESGPMAGLISAARHRDSHYGSGWLLLLSCDQLRWKPEYFQWMAERVKPEAVAVTYHSTSLQPIPGLFHTRIKSVAEAALANSQLSLKRMLESGGEAVSIEQSENPRDWCFNSTAELNALLDKLQQEFKL